eukprot:gene1089-biopygen875
MGAGRSLWRPHGQRSPALLLAVLVFTCLALSATAPGGALLLGAGSCSGMSIIHVKLAASGVSYFSDGVQAALAQDSSVTVNDVVSSPSSVCSSSTLFIFGIRQSSGMADALDTSKACAKNNVMNIGSFTEGMTYRVWNPLSYFTQSDDFIQSALSVRYAVTELRLRRLALLNVAAYGTDGNDMQAAYLKSAGYAESTEYVKIDTSSSGAYNTFQSFNAQAAMLLDYDNTFVSKLLKDSTQGSIVMFTGSYSTSTLMSQITSNLAYSAQKLFIAFPNQMASETSLNYIKLFNSQFSAANPGESLSATDPVQQLLSVAGWLVGTMAVSIFQAMDKSDSRATRRACRTTCSALGPCVRGRSGRTTCWADTPGSARRGALALRTAVQLQPGRSHGVAVRGDTGEQRAQVQQDRRGVGELEPVHPSVQVLHGGGRPADAAADHGAGEQRELPRPERYHGSRNAGQEHGVVDGLYTAYGIARRHPAGGELDDFYV